ncbi:hypothetical protein V2J09_002848 [Rumex salicifolius]
MSSNRANQPPLQLVTDSTSNINPRERNRSHSCIHYKRSFLSTLARLHAGYFRMSLSFGGQALLWKILSQPSPSDDISLLHIFQFLPSMSFLLLWILSVSILTMLSILYILRCFFHFHLVKAEFTDHVGVSYLFAPWISWLLLLQSAPVWVSPQTTIYLVLWWVLTVPIIALDVKLYGQWFTTERRFLANLANPTNHVSVLGNLVAAQASALMGWKEIAVCMFSLGMAHYLVLFVTLYQHLSGGNRLPAMLRPVFFLFFAVPSMSSVAWSSISGSYDTASKMLFFLSLFLFASLACRPNLFKKSMRKFNIAWWAYSFPLTFLALASSEYAREVKGRLAPGLMIILSGLSVIIFLGLTLFTVLNSTKLLKENDPILIFAKDPIV